MDKFATENLILLEFLVDQISFEDSVTEDLAGLRGGETCVSFQFLDNAPLLVSEEDFSPKSGRDFPCKRPNAAMKNGKSCLFSLTPEQAKEALDQFDIYVEVYKKIKPDAPVEKVLIGESLISIVNLFRELVDSVQVNGNENPPAAKTLKDCFQIQNLSGELVGLICVYIRMSCFGKLIVTQFQMNLKDNSVEFKAKEGHYLFKYNNKREGAKCPPGCNLPQPPQMPCCMPQPPTCPPPSTCPSCCTEPPPCCPPQQPCPPPCPPQPCCPMPCPPPCPPPPCCQPCPRPCYPPPCCPQQPCCPPQPCPQQPCPQQPCPQQPCPQQPCCPKQPCPYCCPPCEPCPYPPQPPPCLDPCTLQTPCNECFYCPPPTAPPCCACDDCNYQEIGASMGNNSLTIRVHKDTGKVEQLANGGTASANPCTCTPIGCATCCGNGPPPADDPSAPFKFTMNGCPACPGCCGNSVSITPPTCTAPDGTKITEISDPNKEMFILRIGKKSEGANRKNNLELELCTPRGPEPKPPVCVDTHTTQYEESDVPAGGGGGGGSAKAKSEKGADKSEKGGKKGGAKGGAKAKGGKKKK